MNMQLYTGSSEGDGYSHLSWLLWNDSSSSAIVLGNMMGKVNEHVCIC